MCFKWFCSGSNCQFGRSRASHRQRQAFSHSRPGGARLGQELGSLPNFERIAQPERVISVRGGFSLHG